MSQVIGNGGPRSGWRGRERWRVSKARLVITAVVLRVAPSEVARSYGVSQGVGLQAVARYRVEGESGVRATLATTSQSARRARRRPRSSWSCESRHQLDRRRARCRGRHDRLASRTPPPDHGSRRRRSTGSADAPSWSPPSRKKKPRSSYIRFQAEQPNETWQADFTHHRLADGTDVEILTWLDDHSRYALSVTAHRPVTGPVVVATFRAAIARHGIPFSTLTDNGLVFTTRFAHGGRTSRNGLENELVRLRVRQKNSRPNHPTTCGKVERFQQTLKKWLRTQPTATQPHRAPDPTRPIRRDLQPPPPAPLTPTPRHPRHRLPNPTQRPPPATTNPTPSSASATTASTPATCQPARQRPPPPHRPRPNPRRNPRHHAHRPPRRTRHPRHHRRDHPHTHHRPQPPLPRHRTTHRRTQRTPETETIRTLMRVRTVLDVSRHHTVELRGIEPLTPSMPWKCSAN